MRRLGTSGDWSRDRFTMDPDVARGHRSVRALHEEGLIYRGKRLVNWDPVLQTAVSDLEVVSEEEERHLWSSPIRSRRQRHARRRDDAPRDDARRHRGAVHPDDERYRARSASTCAAADRREIPIIADAYVDPEFGTGVRQDHAGARLQRLRGGPAPRPAADQHLHAGCGDSTRTRRSEYRGLDRFDARKRIVADLEDAGLLVKTEPHKLQVPRGDRSGR